MNRKRGLILTAVLALITLLGAGHYLFWYHPRLRPLAPDPASPVGARLDDPGASLTVWVPYPHQNLPRLREELGLDREALDALASLAGLPSLQTPSLGPLGLPPSNELAFSLRGDDSRLLSARLYPGMALFARLAGRLTGNPWLAGGPVETGRHGTATRWEGRCWTLEDEAGQGTGAGTTVRPSTRAEDSAGLVFIELRGETDFWPRGRYRLVQSASGFDLGSVADPPATPGFDDPALAADEVALLLMQRLRDEGSRTLLLFAQSEDELQEMPQVASIVTAEQPHWTLPGQSLLDLTGRAPLTRPFAGGEIAALDRHSLERAQRLRPLLAAAGDGPGHVLWLDLDAAHRQSRRLGRMFEHLPLIPREQIRRWQQIARISGPLAGRFSHLTVTLTDQPPALHLHLERRRQHP